MALHLVAYTDATGRGGGEMSLGNLVGALDPAIRVSVLGVDPDTVGWIARQRPGVDAEVLPVVRGPRDLGRIGTDSAWQRRCKRLLSGRLDAHVAVGEASPAGPSGWLACPPAASGRCRTSYRTAGRSRRCRTRASCWGPSAGWTRRRASTSCSTRSRRCRTSGSCWWARGARANLEGRAARPDLAGRVTFAGWFEDVRAHLAAVDVVMLPSRSEGFPLTIVEAMLAGLPVVATRVGSVAEAVSEGESGLLVDADDPGALAGALRTLVEDASLRRKLGARGREIAAAAFTVDHMARAYEALYGELGRPT